MNATPGTDAFLGTYMTTLARSACLIAVLALSGACTLKEEAPPPPPAGGPAEPGIPAPPDVAAPPADAIKTASGLASKIIRVGLGEVKPTLKSTVVVHYTGWTTDGKMFDTSTRPRSPGMPVEPITFPMLRENGLPSVIPGWMEVLQLMRAGEKRRVWIPGELAYDKISMPGAPKGMLVFDMELLQIR
jgi:peptidylprolyl isomerase